MSKDSVDCVSIAAVVERIREIYLADSRPWVIGYSGGKDSTCALQLVWSALSGVENSTQRKPVYVLSSDTLVETPVIVHYIDHALTQINEAAQAQNFGKQGCPGRSGQFLGQSPGTRIPGAVATVSLVYRAVKN